MYNKINKKDLVEARKQLGLFTIKELSLMFGVGRASIDYIVNNGSIPYFSPNNKTRFIRLQDYLKNFGLDIQELKKDNNSAMLLSKVESHND